MTSEFEHSHQQSEVFENLPAKPQIDQLDRAQRAIHGAKSDFQKVLVDNTSYITSKGRLVDKSRPLPRLLASEYIIAIPDHFLDLISYNVAENGKSFQLEIDTNSPQPKLRRRLKMQNFMAALGRNIHNHYRLQNVPNKLRGNAQRIAREVLAGLIDQRQKHQ